MRYLNPYISFHQRAEQDLSNKDLAMLVASQGSNYYLSGDEEKASEAFTKARQLEPDNASIEMLIYSVYAEKSSEYYNMGDREKGDEELSKAIDFANQAILKDPQVAFRFHELNALSYLALENSKPENATKNYSLSIESLTKAIESNNDDNAYQYYRRAVAYRFQGNYELALRDINQAIKLESDANPNYYNFRGNIYLNSKEYDKAINDYTKAIQINPDDPQYYENRFNARYNLGDYDQKFGGLQQYRLHLDKG